MIRALLVDDEPHAREVLKKLLADAADVEIAGEAVDGLDALEKIGRLKPALVFLDVQMPGLTGLQLVEMLRREELPYLVFTTAYAEHAARAFDLEAVDYLLKPFDKARVDRALARVRQRLRTGATRLGEAELARLQQEFARLAGLLEDGRTAASLVVHVGNKLRFLDPRNIRYIKAKGNYVEIAAGGEPLLARERLSELEQRLRPSGFLRIHRSMLVNLRCVEEIQPHGQGAYGFLLNGGERVTSAAAYREQVQQAIGPEWRSARRGRE